MADGADLVVVAEFRDRIYPGLVETGRVERGGDKPYHTVISAENYHALEMLTYTHRHSIDAMSTKPEPIALSVPITAQADTKIRHPDGTEKKLPTREFHLMAAADGTFPILLNEWERKVIDAEIDRTGFKGWYRNPDRAVAESLAVAYKDEIGNWKALRPDVIFFGPNHDGSVAVDLVDPHGHHLSDALPKLRGLADFAEQFAEDFGGLSRSPKPVASCASSTSPSPMFATRSVWPPVRRRCTSRISRWTTDAFGRSGPRNVAAKRSTLCGMAAIPTQVYLTEAQRERIAARAAAEGVTPAEIIRQALDSYLEDASPDPALALSITFGAAPEASVPSRDEGSRG